MRFIHFKAPFGAFRPFKNVELATTAEFITHSAAYGLLLGLAGVDRQRKKEFIGTRIAIGCKRLPRAGRFFQQLIQGRRVLTGDGGQLNLRPFWREVLFDLEGYIGFDNSPLEELVVKGINEPSLLDYWGLPFMGDNNFFLERVEVCKKPESCRWFYPFNGERLQRGERLHFLSIWTDYETNMRSRGLLFALTPNQEYPPSDAWIPIAEHNTKISDESGSSL